MKAAVKCGALILPKENTNDNTFKVQKSNELYLIDSNVAVECDSAMIVKLWIEKNLQATDESLIDLIKKLQGDDEMLKNEFINILDGINDSGLLLGDWLNIKFLFKQFHCGVLLLRRKHGKQA